MRTLVITDSPFAEDKFRHGLAEIGVSAKVVTSMEEASAQLASFWPDAVVIDVAWNAEVASWVRRNLTRCRVRTVVTSPALVPVGDALFLPRGCGLDDVADALLRVA